MRHTYKPDFIEKNLKQKSYSIDTSAVAIVLYEKYDCELSASSLVINLRIRRIVKILKKAGIDYADLDVAVYHSGNHFSKIRRLSGTTYNMEDGKIVESDLDGDNILKTGYGHVKEKKFSMPSVHEGSVIDYSYEVDEDMMEKFGTWRIDGYIPKLYSELQVVYPFILDVDVRGQNTPDFTLSENEKQEDRMPNAFIAIRQKGGGITDKRWVRKNIPALIEEPFISNINDYSEKVYLMVGGILAMSRFDTWTRMNEYLFKSDKFYQPIVNSGESVKRKVRLLTAGEKDTLAKAKRIYNYVRDSITLQDNQNIWIKNDPDEVLKNKSGSMSEKNILLAAMLWDAKVNCSPVLISTKDNGKVTTLFTNANMFDHTACEATIGKEKYYLDVSGKYNPFGVLPEDCYNGYARVVNKEGAVVTLTPDAAKEKSFFKMVTTNSSADSYAVAINYFIGQYEAMGLREKWISDSQEAKKYVVALLKDMPLSLHVGSYKIDNLSDPDRQLTLEINARADWPVDEKMIYLNPYFLRFFDSNPFKSSIRKYPVELPYTFNTTYYWQLQLPKAYTVDEGLKSLNLSFTDDASYKDAFQYDSAGNTMTLSANMKISRTVFKPEEYSYLKEFFDKMITQQQKDIVIKKLN